MNSCGGGELLNNIIKKGGVSERDIANYVKQILEGLEYMHSRYVGHLGLTIGDVMVARVNSNDIRFGDFSLAARLMPGKDYFLEYGHPEFVAPEIANKQAATVLADMWYASGHACSFLYTFQLFKECGCYYLSLVSISVLFISSFHSNQCCLITDAVCVFLRLSGISPFLGEHDRETLTRVQQGKINFAEEAFAGVSDDAKDFMSKLLVFDPT
ncbi:UNVERIFIED_CONTAM: Unc-89 [Trichonephila clavipes]